MELISYDKTNERSLIRNSEIFISVNQRGKFNFSQGVRRMLPLPIPD